MADVATNEIFTGTLASEYVAACTREVGEVVALFHQPQPPVINSPDDGEVTNDTTPTVEGSAVPFGEVDVYLDGAYVATVGVDEDGLWEWTSGALAQGAHDVAAKVTDSLGVVSEFSETINFTVDTTAPTATEITAPEDASVSNEDRPTIEGVADPLSTVRIYVDGGLVGTVTADAGGDWSYRLTLAQALDDGEYELTATATDAAGNISSESDPVTIEVDTSAPAAPVVTSPADESETGDTTPTISGTSEAGASIDVFLNGSLVGTVAANGGGNWSYTLSGAQTLNDGEYTASARASDEAGNESALSAEVDFTVSTADVPEVTVVDPPAGSELAASQAITLDVTDDSGELRAVVIMVKMPELKLYEVAYDSEDFAPGYVNSSRSGIALGFRFVLRRLGNWPQNLAELSIKAVAVDKRGGGA